MKLDLQDKATAEKKCKVEEETFGETRKRKANDAGQISQKKDLVGQHPMILSHIFLRSMKGKFHCARKN